ncbi:MAG: alpha/beta hydrolase [Solirubrobacteraceae bacterium]
MGIGEYALQMGRHRDVETAAPASTGEQDGLAYALYLPSRAPRGGVVIIHGAGSSGDSHADFARLCRAGGLAAIVYDQRGHGASAGALGGGALDDVAQMAALLPAGPVFLRGSSMGGFMALAAAPLVGARAVVAICPAGRELLLRGLRHGRFEFRADQPALEDLLATVDLEAAAGALGPDLLLMHAEGDEEVPVEHSALLHDASPGSRLLRLPGGHHRSLQHDAELQAEAVRFLLRRA